MRRSIFLAVLAAVLTPSLAPADEVPSSTAHTVLLKDHYTAVVYYVDDPEGFRIVTTLAAEDGPAMRFTNHLIAGQSAILETAGEVGEPSSGIVLSRIGGQLHVEPLPKAAPEIVTGVPVNTNIIPATVTLPAQR
jgi:hypothetical protein